ncbi:hypothetical protein BD408DRAFT_173648 [Parasitella parasitica]|nr:hypothetical protein BD408DRAFT_173648 [Parasitella parasitica]
MVKKGLNNTRKIMLFQNNGQIWLPGNLILAFAKYGTLFTWSVGERFYLFGGILGNFGKLAPPLEML